MVDDINEVDEIEALSHRDYSGGIDQINAKALYFRRVNGIAYHIPLDKIQKFDTRVRMKQDLVEFDQNKARTF